MKVRINTDEGVKIFNHDTVIPGMVYCCFNESSIKKNRKMFNLNLEFKGVNTMIKKIGDKVIFTIKEDIHSPMLQFLITSKSVHDNLPLEVFDLLNPAFEILKVETLADLKNLKNIMN